MNDGVRQIFFKKYIFRMSFFLLKKIIIFKLTEKKEFINLFLGIVQLLLNNINSKLKKL